MTGVHAPSEKPAKPAAAHRHPAADRLLALQRQAGNRAVTAALRLMPVQRLSEGLAGSGSQRQYVAGVRAVLDQPEPADVDARARAAIKVINDQLATTGVPPVELAPLNTGGGASFVAKEWQLKVGRSGFEPTSSAEDRARLAGTLYHEARHAEQTWRAACLFAKDSGKAGEALHRDLMVKIEMPLSLAQRVEKDAQAATTHLAAEETAADRAWLDSHLDKGNEEIENQVRYANGPFVETAPLVDALTAVLTAAGQAHTRLTDAVAGTVKLSELREDAAWEDLRSTCETAWTEWPKVLIRSTAEMDAARDLITRYRRIPEEAEAHILGWAVEDLYRGAAPSPTATPGIAAGDTLFKAVDAVTDTLTEALDTMRYEFVLEKEPRDDAKLINDDLTSRLAAIGTWRPVLDGYFHDRQIAAFARTNI